MQRDPYNLATLQLPREAQGVVSILGRSARDLMLDPSQQGGYGYVSGNPFRFVDLTGLEGYCSLREIGFDDGSVPGLGRGVWDGITFLPQLLFGHSFENGPTQQSVQREFARLPADYKEGYSEGFQFGYLLGGAATMGLGLAKGIAGGALKSSGGGNATGVEGFNYTRTAGKHLNDIVKKGPYKGQKSRPYMDSPHTIVEILQTGKGVKDPGGLLGTLRYDVPGSFRGSKGTWELVLNPETKMIYHFNFVN